MNKEKLDKLKTELNKIIPDTELDELKRKLTKELKEKEREIVGDVLLKKLTPLFKKLDISDPIVEIKMPDLSIGNVAPKIEVITLKAGDTPQPIINVSPPKIVVKAPDITVKPPKVKVVVQGQKIPEFPKEMTVKGFEEYTKAMLKYYHETMVVTLEGVNHKAPLPVIMLDEDGKPFRMTAPKGTTDSGGGGGLSVISMKDKEPTGYQKLTVDDTEGGVGLTVPAGSNYAVMVCENAHIRWRDDGTGPTSSSGMPLYSRQSLALDGALLLNQFKAIRQTTTSGVLHISYYKK